MTKKTKTKLCVFSTLKVLWLGFIFSNSLKNKADSASQSKPLEELIKPPIEAVVKDRDADRLAELIIRKGAHITEFFVLTVLCVFVLKSWGKSEKQSLCLASVFSLCVAGLDETLQLISDRGAAFGDVLIDFIGVLLAVFMFLIIYMIKKKQR